MEELWDIRRVARLLQLSERTVYQMAREGRLPARRIGGRWRFRPEEIERWLDDSVGHAEPEPGAVDAYLNRAEFEERLGGIIDPLERRLGFVALLAGAVTALGWQPPVVVGGHAVEFYTAGGYATVDIELVSGHEPLEAVLPKWGFVARGRHWVHEGLGLVVEAPGSHLEPEQRERVTAVETAGATAYVLGVEDVIVDRLAACVHWRSEEDCGWARVLLALFQDGLDEEYLWERARLREVQARLRTVVDELS
ncbi:MAG TPA: helix-turn-helix domain-containing protein, partial [Thermoleophilia bacterium]|nr:helix-turn-helix domain-containing protein [Thermoleophilia bacterium]